MVLKRLFTNFSLKFSFVCPEILKIFLSAFNSQIQSQWGIRIFSSGKNPWVTHMHNTHQLQTYSFHSCVGRVQEFLWLVAMLEWLLLPTCCQVCAPELLCLPLLTRWQLSPPVLGAYKRAAAAATCLCSKWHLPSLSQLPGTVVEGMGREWCASFLFLWVSGHPVPLRALGYTQRQCSP